MTPLAMARVGDTNIIRKITGRDEVRQRLAELGFVVGEAVTVVNELGGQHGPVRQGQPRRAGQGHGHADSWCEALARRGDAAGIGLSLGVAAFRRRGAGLDRKGEGEMRTLRDVKIGQTAKIKRLHGEGAIKRRIMDMGLTKGTEVYVRKVAPLGDPMELTVRGYELSVRKGDAEMIEVE